MIAAVERKANSVRKENDSFRRGKGKLVLEIAKLESEIESRPARITLGTDSSYVLDGIKTRERFS